MPVDNNSTTAKNQARACANSAWRYQGPQGPWEPMSGLPRSGSLLVLSGMLPVVNGKLPITGRLGENLSVEQGREAVSLDAINSSAISLKRGGFAPEATTLRLTQRAPSRLASSVA